MSRCTLMEVISVCGPRIGVAKVIHGPFEGRRTPFRICGGRQVTERRGKPFLSNTPLKAPPSYQELLMGKIRHDGNGRPKVVLWCRERDWDTVEQQIAQAATDLVRGSVPVPAV